jgi:hypothetical protein
MPLTYTCAHSRTPSIERGWKWNNDPAEDAGLIAALQEAITLGRLERQDFQIDRSGDGPVLKWQAYARPWGSKNYLPTGNWVQTPLAVGDVVRTRPGVAPDLADGNHEWECDADGRVYDLDDLLSAGTRPA